MVKQKVTVSSLFENMQQQMVAKMAFLSSLTSHPTTKGDISELGWLGMFQEYLPHRYRAEKAFVIDSQNQVSDQIDIVIFDPQYSPFIFKSEGAIYVPAESVYAVFEVKPKMSKSNILYAGEKAATVRSMHRTSIGVPTANGFAPPKKPGEIIAGILTTRAGWKKPFSESFLNSIKQLKTDEILDIGCALQGGSFVYEGENRELITSDSKDGLKFFFMKTLKLLQGLATAPPIDLETYITKIEEN